MNARRQPDDFAARFCAIANETLTDHDALFMVKSEADLQSGDWVLRLQDYEGDDFDSETGIEKWIDTSFRSTRNNYEKWWIDHIELIRNIFKRCGVDSTELRTDLDYVKPLIKLFKKR